MKNKRLLQKVDLKGNLSKTRPILVENDHPLFESYEDLKPYFSGNIQLAYPRKSNDKTWSNTDQVEYYSPVEGSVEKISPIEFNNKVKPLLEKLSTSIKGKNFDISDPDEFEKKALIDSFKFPSDELYEYLFKVGSYYVLCNWGLENAPKLGELPPPPTKPFSEEESDFEPTVNDIKESSKTEDNTGTFLDDDSKIYEEEQDEFEYEEEVNQDDLENSDSIAKDDENEAVSWFRNYWWKILLGILLFILILFLLNECGSGSSENISNQTEVISPNSSNNPKSENSGSGGAPNGSGGAPSGGGGASSGSGGAPSGSGGAPSGSGGAPSGGAASNPKNGSPAVTPSPPSDQLPPLLLERPEGVLENEQLYKDGIPTDQWNEIGSIFQMETDEGVWYWLRLRNGETYLMDFIPSKEQTDSIEPNKNNFNSI